MSNRDFPRWFMRLGDIIFAPFYAVDQKYYKLLLKYDSEKQAQQLSNELRCLRDNVNRLEDTVKFIMNGMVRK